ncbi:MAG: TldD/PmbA family protein, partial [Euryarchaeota archaeon]|nr:TldD/PmbA family protein [Euryarchaeota archaeon]
GNPEISGFGTSSGMCVRVLVHGGMGFASTDKLTRDSVKERVQTAVRMAKASSRLVSKRIIFSDEPAHIADYSVPQKKKLADVELDDIVEVLTHIDRAMSETAPLVNRFLQLGMSEKTKFFTNSDDSKIGSVIPRVVMFSIPTIMESGKMSQAMIQRGVSMGWEYMDPVVRSEEICHEIAMTYKNMKEGVKAPTGKIDMVLGPEVVGIAAHESCGHPYEADRITGREAAQAGESFINAGMLGTRIGSDVATVIDDPTVENSYGFYLYDDEGVKARPKILIKNGIINEFLHNRETAAAMDLGASNAAARAQSYNREAIVRMSNTFVQPGDHEVQELFDGVKLGVYMKNFMEWNIDDKRYNQRYIGREAYLIENGEIKAPVKAPILELTTPAFWSAVDAVAKDLAFSAATCGKGEPGQGVAVYTGGPHIRLKGITLGVGQ